MPLAPAATAPARIGLEIAAVLAVHQVRAAVIDSELSRMLDCRFGPTANRSVLNIMNEFAHLAEIYRWTDPGMDLVRLDRRLAATPCSPLYRLYRRNVSPDREQRAREELAVVQRR
jgi:hypothetical protein